MNTIKTNSLTLVLALSLFASASGQQPSLSSNDIAVMTTAFHHFVRADIDVELISEHSDNVGTNRSQLIIINNSATNSLGFLSDSQLDSFTERGRKRIRPKLSGGMTQSLRTRASQTVSLVPLGKANPSFKLVDEAQLQGWWFADDFPQALAYAEPWLPSYNESHDEAIFTFMFGPRTHHATQAFYKLKKSKQGWKVEWHEFIYYL